LTASTTVDMSDLDGEVWVVFRWGGISASTTAEVSVDAGGGFELVGQELLPGSSGCFESHVLLSTTVPEVHNNPSVGLQFLFEASAGNPVRFFGAWVFGGKFCSATPNVIQLSPLIETGGGHYDFSVDDTYGYQLAGKVTCTWAPAESRPRTISQAL